MILDDNIFERYSLSELIEMVDSLNSEIIPDNALIRKIAREYYNTDNENLIQLIGLGVPIATELTKRIQIIKV